MERQKYTTTATYGSSAFTSSTLSYASFLLFAHPRQNRPLTSVQRHFTRGFFFHNATCCLEQLGCNSRLHSEYSSCGNWYAWWIVVSVRGSAGDALRDIDGVHHFW